MLKLKGMREGKGLKCKVVAEKMGISRITLWQWENGKRNPSLDNLKKLAKLYGCTIDDLVSEQEVE